MKPAGVIVRAKDWQVQSVPTHGECVRFMRTHHYARGASNMSVYRHGMYRAEPDLFPLVGELVGVALWMPPTRVAAEAVAAEAVAAEEWRGVLCLSRLAVAPGIGTNGASFLLGRSMRLIDRGRWPWLLTFADPNHGHTGAIYKATNWTDQGESPGGDVWTGPDGVQRGHKRAGRNWSVVDMTAAGFVRTANSKKRRFVHHVVR